MRHILNSVIPQGTLVFQSESVDDDNSEFKQEEELERALFSRYIDEIDRNRDEEDDDQEESDESDNEN